MSKVLSTQEIVGIVPHEGNHWEVRASGEADFEAERSILRVTLHAVMRPREGSSRPAPFVPDWLPKEIHCTENVPEEDSVALAREIFQSWVKRIRHCLRELETPSTP